MVLGGFDRADAAADLGISQHDVARALAAARTALRRSVRQLQGSGWCLRAEALLSDRLDDVLDGAGAVRLDVHLRNCPRCVDHERRLIQAQNALVAEFGREPAPGEAAELTLVQPADTPEPTRGSSDASRTGSLAGIVAVSSGVLVLPGRPLGDRGDRVRARGCARPLAATEAPPPPPRHRREPNRVPARVGPRPLRTRSRQRSPASLTSRVPRGEQVVRNAAAALYTSPRTGVSTMCSSRDCSRAPWRPATVGPEALPSSQQTTDTPASCGTSVASASGSATTPSAPVAAIDSTARARRVVPRTAQPSRRSAAPRARPPQPQPTISTRASAGRPAQSPEPERRRSSSRQRWSSATLA